MFIDQNGLINILENTKTHQFINVESETNPKLLVKGRNSKLTIPEKFNCFSTDIKKISQFVCMLGLDYKHVIESRLIKEGKDISLYEKGSSWFEHVEGTRNLVRHKETKELYVYLFLVANNIPTSAYYNTANGTMIDKEELTEYLPKESAPTNQGLNDGNEVLVRTFKLSSIRKIVLDKETYLVR
jgi:hypothetical protein